MCVPEIIPECTAYISPRTPIGPFTRSCFDTCLGMSRPCLQVHFGHHMRKRSNHELNARFSGCSACDVLALQNT